MRQGESIRFRNDFRPRGMLSHFWFSGPSPATSFAMSKPASSNNQPPLTPESLRAKLREAAGHIDRGALKEAASLLNAVRRQAPDHPDALHLSGLVALKAGNAATAENFLRHAIAKSPAHAFFHVNLGNALRHQRKAEEALAAYAKAVSLDPQFPGSYLNRGMLLADMGRLDEAEADLERAIACAPQDPGPYAQFAQLHMNRGDFHAMAAAYKRGLEALPGHPHFLAGLASAYERLSDLEAAKPLAEAALAAMPNTPMALKTWARVMRRLGALEEVTARLERVPLDKYPPGAARLIHAELALAYDELGDIPNAFLNFSRQNELAGKIGAAQSVDKRAYMDQVSALRTAFEGGLGGNWPQAGDVTPGHAGPPVFLVGFPRSGTTLLDQILDAHPGVQVIEERPVLLAVRDAVMAMEGGYPGALDRLGAAEIAGLRARYWAALEAQGADLQNKLVINKLPLNIIHAGLIRRVFPEAKFILALRHPLDSVLSCFMQDFELNASMAHFLELRDAARLYEAVMGLWRLYEDRLGLEAVSIPIRYEDLIQDVRGAVEPVLSHLGLSWDEAQRDHTGHAKARGTIRTPSYAQVTQPLYGRAAGRHERYATYLEPVRPLLAPYIAAFGYELD